MTRLTDCSKKYPKSLYRVPDLSSREKTTLTLSSCVLMRRERSTRTKRVVLSFRSLISEAKISNPYSEAARSLAMAATEASPCSATDKAAAAVFSQVVGCMAG